MRWLVGPLLAEALRPLQEHLAQISSSSAVLEARLARSESFQRRAEVLLLDLERFKGQWEASLPSLLVQASIVADLEERLNALDASFKVDPDPISEVPDHPTPGCR